MAWLPTKVLRQKVDVDRRLDEMGLQRAKLLRVRDVAFGEAGNATPHHCANAAGTFSYQHGVFALRDQFIGPVWRVDRLNNVETIVHKFIDLRVGYQNVDKALSDEYQPRSRSEKGSGSERLCQNNLFGVLPHLRKGDLKIEPLYFLMVDEIGACELSCPIVENGAFAQFVERIYLSDGSDFGGKKLPLDEDDAISDFDPMVARKA
jgi:hypothetical protein